MYNYKSFTCVDMIREYENVSRSTVISRYHPHALCQLVPDLIYDEMQDEVEIATTCECKCPGRKGEGGRLIALERCSSHLKIYLFWKYSTFASISIAKRTYSKCLEEIKMIRMLKKCDEDNFSNGRLVAIFSQIHKFLHRHNP